MASDLEEFLRRARRTWTAWAIAEHAGVGLLCGCSCVVLLLPILLWQGEPGQSVAVVLPLIGAALGAGLGYRTRPSLRAVAEMADQRFGTSDLLATALALRETIDPWHLNIVSMADSYAAGLSPAALTPHRLGRRAWSGILLSCIAAITLGLLSGTSQSDRAQAVDTPASGGADAWEQIADHADRPVAQNAGAGPEAKAEMAPDSQSMGSDDAISQGGMNAHQSDRFARDGQTAMGAGGGSGQTDSANLAMPAVHADSIRRDSVDGGAIAAGGSGAEMRGANGGSATAGQIDAGSGPAVTPWAGTTWPAAAKAAINAVDAGQIPDTYRGLVRDYFDRSDHQ